MTYEVHLDVFDGPFNLLLQLISAEEVDLYAVSLSRIVDVFLVELHKIEALDLELATEFLLIAATLVDLKCRRLLPGSEGVDLDEDLALFEARDYLLARLVECKTFNAAAAALLECESRAERSSPRRQGPDDRFDSVAPDLLAGVTKEMLAGAARRAFADRPVPAIATAHLHGDEITVADTLDLLVGLLPARPRITLGQLLRDDHSTPRFVATFLALLELYKREMIDLEQQENFADLVIRWTAHGGSYAIDDVESYDDIAPMSNR
jgi:segregation and condensation protein A